MLWAILWLLGNIFIAVNTMPRITSDHTCRGALPLPDTCYQATFSGFACFGPFSYLSFVKNCSSGARYLCMCSVFIRAKTPLRSEVATHTCSGAVPMVPTHWRVVTNTASVDADWAREWKLQSNKLDSGITPSLEIIFNKFPKVADFDYIFQPGAGNWLKRVGCPNLCIPGCMKYDYGSTIWIAF